MLLSTLLLLAGVTVLANWLVDVHGVYRPATAEQLSRIDQFWYMRSSKPLLLRMSKPETVIFGSSRAGRIPPASGYNAAIPGATLGEIERMLAYVLAQADFQRASIGLDFRAFLHGEDDVRFGFDPGLLLTGYPTAGLGAAAAAHKHLLLSTRAVTLSLQAGLGRERVHRARYNPDGSWFTLPDDEPIRQRYLRSARQLLPVLRGAAETRPDLSRFETILRRCYSGGHDCLLFITPVHATYLELLAGAGALGAWDDWHRRLVAMNARLAAEYGAPELPLLGFNDLARPVSGSLLGTQDLVEDWFKDPIHFRPRFGAIIGEALARPGDGPGTVLNPGSIDDYLERVELVHARYRRAHADSVAFLRERLGLEAVDGPG